MSQVLAAATISIVLVCFVSVLLLKLCLDLLPNEVCASTENMTQNNPNYYLISTSLV